MMAVIFFEDSQIDCMGSEISVVLTRIAGRNDP